ncbi:MAG: hypothetical protein M0Z85_09415 [Gammaproteobacteria bacterium]|nr:hypothetical protein [Gammaproteobacteria bacterium]
MPKFVVEYELPYTHVVSVGIEAPTAEAACKKAEDLFNNGSLLDNTKDCPVLSDEYLEDGDAGVPIEFRVTPVEAYPSPDALVQKDQGYAAAIAALKVLCQAYKAGEKTSEVAWEDLNQAYEEADTALRLLGEDPDEDRGADLDPDGPPSP